MLRLTCARLAMRRGNVPLRMAGSVQKQAFGYGEVAPKDAPGFGEYQLKPAETPKETAQYIWEGMTNPPKYKEIVEGFGYPGQKHSAGGITTVGRIYYGPGRYDYGRPVMPKSWFANFFYPFWEFGHLMFVADRWIAWRQLRHFLGIMVAGFPMWVQMQWNVKMWSDFKATHAQ
mmetsp:Transcript_82456/g.167136  ORF Transcript_82456/g.167136 Transcript_82456/m.167136 type:complete len:174 (-) Transcript_82456:106-627(-)